MTKKQTPLFMTKLSSIQFAMLGAFAVFTIIFDAGNVLTREAVYYRWILASILFVLFTVFWACTKKANKQITFMALVACVVGQIALAGFSVYWERGMASMSTALFMLPIVSMSLSGSRTYTVATALLCAGTYVLACTKYFYDFFNEGYRVQLYGQLFFFGAVYLIVGWTAATLAHAYSKK